MSMKKVKKAELRGAVTMSQMLAPHRAPIVEMLAALGAKGDPEAIFDRMLEIADLEPEGVLAWLVGGATRARGGIRPPNEAARAVLEKYGMPIAEEPAAK